MKKALFLAAMCLMSIGAMAQTTKTVTGAVIDKNGNPLPGALVEATGGADNVMTDADGTFSIEVPIWLKSLTAKYAGYYDKAISVKNKNNVLFKMSGSKEGNYFINAVYSHFEEDYGGYDRAGLMGGYLGKWGWYVKALYNIENDFGISGSVGIIKRISQPVYIYLGAGYTQFAYDYYYGYYSDKTDGGIVDLGMIYKISHFNLNLGGSVTKEFDGSDLGFAVQVSLGYNF